jgi:hypothetical protein
MFHIGIPVAIERSALAIRAVPVKDENENSTQPESAHTLYS